jgi:D-alanyl-lipoteichoic acid acyltransferase DltB (MBOAT superfamily)
LLFDSPVYFVFLLCIVLVYWRLNWRRQNIFLLVASYFFYGWWDWRFLGLMMLSTTLDYFIGQSIADLQDPRRRKQLFILSLTLNFTFLGVFKYFNFFVDSLASTLATLGFHHLPLPLLRVILPPGISFYTFQEVAYIVDVYYGKQQPSRSFIDYGLFVSLFPHLIAGPIQRPGHLLGQVQKPRAFDPVMFFDGLMLIALGLFRKCVFADNFAVVANAAFDGRLGHHFVATAIGAVAFGFQIYGDFSGYSDLARGSAQLLGFHFVVNFRRPYLAVTLQDFWRRWHISLSTWLRDYLYIPLGGSRKGNVRTYLNLMITMVLGGLWHGANWTFLVWGGLHGTWLAVERFFAEDLRSPIPRALGSWASRGITLAVVALTWIFFRATKVSEAAQMIGDLAVWHWEPQYAAALAFVAVLGGLVVATDLLMERFDEEYLFQRTPVFSAAMSAGLIILTAFFGATDSSAFIYFQF